MSITDYTHALVRTVPRSFAPAYGAKGTRIDPELTDTQHAAYVASLERAGVTVQRLAPDEAFYDCVFVEDTAIVWGDRLLVTRTTSHREGEQRSVAAALSPSHKLSYVSAGAQLEGGDVLHTERVTYVGLTGRTNEAGANDLAVFFGNERPVVPVRVSDALHLKTVATYLGNGTLLVKPGHVDLRTFDVEDIIETADGEEGANCVRVRDTLIVPDNSPATFARLKRFADTHSLTIVPLDLSEFAKGDGSATCLSLLWRQR